MYILHLQAGALAAALQPVPPDAYAVGSWPRSSQATRQHANSVYSDPAWDNGDNSSKNA